MVGIMTMKARKVNINGWGQIEMVDLDRHETDSGKVFYTMDPELFDRVFRSPVSYNVFVKEKRYAGGYWYTNSPWVVVERLKDDE